MKLKIHNPQGMKRSEIGAIHKLAKELRGSWYGYGSFLVQDKQGSMEIDLLIFTHSRILLVEIKNWAGEIESDGSSWCQTVHGKQRFETSPVHIKREHARRLSTLFKTELQHLWGCYYNVEHVVVLSGTADIKQMPESEKKVVFKIEDFIKIKDENYSDLLPERNEHVFNSNKLPRPNEDHQIEIFENWMMGGGAIKKRHRKINGYQMSDDKNTFFAHPHGVYDEIPGHHCDDVKSKALMRRWNFSPLGHFAMSQEQKANLGLREGRLIRYVEQNNRQVSRDYLMQDMLTLSQDDVDDDLVEVYKQPPLLVRLDEHIVGVARSQEDKKDLLRAILAPFSALHSMGIAHRDVASERLWWDKSTQAVIVSGLVAARFPEETNNQSAGDVRSLLSSNSIPLPEDTLSDTAEIDPYKLDVYQLGVLAYRVAYGSSLDLTGDSAKWIKPTHDVFNGALDEWLQKAIEMLPEDRFKDAMEMLEQLNLIFADEDVTKKDNGDNVSSLLSEHCTETNPMMAFVQAGGFEQDIQKQRMAYQTDFDGKPALIKIWTSLRPELGNSGRNRRLMQFVKRCQIIQSNSLPVPKLFDFGFSIMGLYIVQEFVEGSNLDDWLAENKPDTSLRLDIAEKLIRTINQCHDVSIAHGDLKPENLVLYQGTNEEWDWKLIDILDLDADANTLQSGDYAPKRQVDSFARDRYATYLIIDELFIGCSDIAQIREEIKNALGNETQEIPLSLEPLRDSIELSGEPSIPEKKPITLSSPHLKLDSDVELLESDNGKYYLSVNSRKNRIYITGKRKKISVFLDKKDDVFSIKSARISLISPSDWLSDAQSATNPRRKEIEAIEQPILLSKANGDSNREIIDFVFQLPFVSNSLKPEGKDDEKPVIKNIKKTEFNLKALWKEIVDAERDQHPLVTVAGHPEKHGRNAYKIPVEENIDQFELLSSDIIQVSGDEPDSPRNYGTLNLLESADGVIVVNDPKGCNFLRPGIKLQLIEQRSAVSWNRRYKALHRILQEESLIPDLAHRFETDKKINDSDIAPVALPSSELLKKYNRLDPSKEDAFKGVLNGRLNVIMGPPGTGKTTLLAYLIDYLNRQKNEINKILLVSQSHAAVNEVAIRAREVIKDLAIEEGLDPEQVEPSMVRLGEIERIPPTLHDVHVNAIQSQYRTKFYRELESRVLALAPKIGLPLDVVSDAGAIFRRFGFDLSQYVKARNETSRLQCIDDDLLKKSELERLKKNQQISNRLHNMLSNKLREFTEIPEAVLTKIDPLLFLLEELAKKHSVNNPNAVIRLKEVFDISYSWYDRLSVDHEGFSGFLANTRKIVIGTLVGIGKGAYNIEDNQYDVVIIDEAGRASASELAMAMQSGKRIILVGDHKQLPPLYNANVIDQVIRKLNIERSEVMRTDFERAYNSANGFMLNTQYRMAPAIGSLVSSIFYEGKLLNGRGASPDWMDFLPAPWNSCVTWLDTSNHKTLEKQFKTGKVNLDEVRLICGLIEQLAQNDEIMANLNAWYSKDSIPPIGIITGYRGQVDELERQLDTASWAVSIRPWIRIDTIDAYQGQESRILLLSLVRHNEKSSTGFMEDRSRINVALSRAQERLIIIGAASMWNQKNQDSPLAEVLRYITEQHGQDNPDYQIKDLNSLKQSKELINGA